MAWQELFTVLVLAGIVYALARDLAPPAGVMVGGMVAVMVAGVVTVDQAVSGFSNPAPITIAALYVLARAIEKTGALAPILSKMLGRSSSDRITLARLLAPTAAVSGFINNTPIVAMLMPQVEAWARQHRKSPSAVLMPLSFAAILGGTMTLTGTATNIVVSGLLAEAGEPPLAFFELAWVGIPVAILGLVVLVLTTPLLLPARRSVQEQSAEEFREFILDMKVTAGGPMDGVTVEQAGLRHLTGVFLVQIERDGETSAPVAPHNTLRGGDLLRFAGRADTVVDLQARPGLETTENRHVSHIASGESAFFEAVIGADSPLVGHTVRDVSFRSRYQAAVIAVHRSGQRVNAKIGDVKMRVGDTLLLLADPGFKSRWADRRDFLLISPLRAAPPVASPKAWYVFLIGAGIVAVAASGVLPLVTAALLGATLLVLTGTVTPGEARSSVDLDVIITIAAAFSLSFALIESGLAERIALGVVELVGGMGVVPVLIAITILTFLMTEIITAKASVPLVIPIAFAAAAAMGADPRPFAIAVAVAGALGFLSPIGYPTNTMVYGPGGYRYTDYLRLGMPLTLIVLICASVIIPLRWPL